MEVSWPARFTRIRESVDPSTRTIGVVVTVDGPYRMAEAGRRPPLAKNMFVEVELRGKAVPGRIVIPRSALHDGMVYVVGAEMRLERRLVTVGARQSNFVTVDSGLAAGETVVVSDLSPAIDGMLLTPVEDAGLLARVVAAATGQGALR